MSHRKILPVTKGAKAAIMKRWIALCLMAVVASLVAARAGTEACSAPRTPEEIRRCDPDAAAAVRKNELFLSRGSSVLALRAGQSLERAIMLIPSHPGRDVESIHPALDAIYVLAREDGSTRLLQVPLRRDGVREVGFTEKYVCHSRNCRSFPARKNIRIITIPLPVAGSISRALANPETGGITLRFAAKEAVAYVFEPSASRFIEVDNIGAP